MRKYLITDREFPHTISILKEMVNEAVVPGSVFGYWELRDPDAYWVYVNGNRRLVPTAQPMQIDTIFDCASLTKACVTTTLIQLLVDRAWISIDDPVRKFLPEAQSGNIRIRDLLTHSSGYPAWIPLYQQMLQKLSTLPMEKLSVRQSLAREIILSIQPVEGIGQKVVYSDVGFWILGFVIEELFQQPLFKIAEENIFKPLQMSRTSFRVLPPDSALSITDENCAATFRSELRGGVLQGQVDDDNCWAMGGVAGHAGMFSTMNDLMRFVRGVFHSRLVSESTRGLFFREAISIDGVRRALGWDMPSLGSEQVSSTGKAFSPYSVGHLGFTGTSMWYDPIEKVAIVLLTNRVHPDREGAHVEKFRKKYRPLIHESFRSEYSKIKDLS